MKFLIFVVLVCCGKSFGAPQNIQHFYTLPVDVQQLIQSADNYADAKVAFILQLLNYRNAANMAMSRYNIAGPQFTQIANVPHVFPPSLPINSPTAPHLHPHSHQRIPGIPGHGHSHSHDPEDNHSDEIDHDHDGEQDLTGSDPEHKPGEVFKENFEKGVLQVDRMPIVPIGGHDH